VVLTNSVEDPAPATGFGDRVAVAPLGSPDTLSETLPVKPAVDDTVTRNDADRPLEILIDEGAMDSEKSGPETTSVADTVRASEPLVPVTVRG
jgi:hypothetical protein